MKREKERNKELAQFHKNEGKKKKVKSPPLPLLKQSFAFPQPRNNNTSHHSSREPQLHVCRAVCTHLSVSRLLGKGSRHSSGVTPQTHNRLTTNPKGMRQCPQNPPLHPPVLSFASLHTSQHRNT